MPYGGGGSGDGHSLDAADGNPTDAIYVDNIGWVGISNTSAKLHIVSSGGNDDLRLTVTTATAAIFIEGGAPGDVSWALASGTPNAGDFSIRETSAANYLAVRCVIGYRVN